MIGQYAQKFVGISAVIMIAQVPALDVNAATLSCAQAAEVAEANAQVPPGLLLAIGNVEAGRSNGSSTRTPWPWTIRAVGVGRFFTTAEEAVAAVQALDSAGVRSIDIGCFQINLLHHPHAFANLASGFDPLTNAFAAAQFLAMLHVEFGAWEPAISAYHSRTVTLGAAYLREVLVSWHEIGPDQATVVTDVHVWGPNGELGLHTSMSSYASNAIDVRVLLPRSASRRLPHIVTVSIR